MKMAERRSLKIPLINRALSRYPKITKALAVAPHRRSLNLQTQVQLGNFRYLTLL